MTGSGGILCVFAHPDDEQIGTSGALLACTERGIPVNLLCATRGEAGEISDPAYATPETLAQVRERELNAACTLLGLQPPEFLPYHDGKLNEVDPLQLRADVLEAVVRIRPRVMITFDENGGYGHPDHIAIHHATVGAVELATVAGYGVDKLYVTAYPRTAFELLNEGLAAIGEPPLDFGSVQTISPDEIGTPDERITTVVDVRRFYERRLAALFAHRTQYGPSSYLARFSEELTRRIFAFDSFVRLSPPPPTGTPLPDETDLWDGLS